MNKSKIAFITGTTAGFGKATAYKFAENGYNLILSGRRQERNDMIAEDIRTRFGVEVVVFTFDVRNRTEVENAFASLDDKWKNIDVLVNNAGLALGFGPIQDGNPDDWDAMIDTNLKGLLYVSNVIIPEMIKRKSGHIFNLGSLAGKEVYAGGNVYCASKFGVDAISKAMRIDLLPYGIKVTQIAPGACETEFSVVRFKGDEEKAANIYKGYQPIEAQDIADIIWFAASRPAHVCMNDIIITPVAQANTVHTFKGE